MSISDHRQKLIFIHGLVAEVKLNWLPIGFSDRSMAYGIVEKLLSI